jgi:DNA-binding MarR family transcriptional regulator
VSASAANRASADGQDVLVQRASSEGLLLALLGQHAMRHLRAAHATTGLSPRQFHLLGLLHDRGAMTQRELGAAMKVDPSILVTLLNPLETDGYLSRDRDPADRRRHVVNLTAAGEHQLNRAAKAQRQAEDELFVALTDAQRAQLRKLLLALSDHLAIEQQDPCASADAKEPQLPPLAIRPGSQPTRDPKESRP